MARITIFPGNQSVTIDGYMAENINCSGVIPEDVHCIQWDGNSGWIEKIPCDCEFVPHEEITSLDPYSTLIELAEGKINARQNPTIYYAIADNIVYNSLSYNMADPLYYTDYPLPSNPPAGFTLVAPEGQLNKWQSWLWNGTSWVASSFPLSYSLEEGKAHLIALVRNQYNGKINNQLRMYNMWELSNESSLESLNAADSSVHGFSTVAAYDSALKLKAEALVNTITSSTSLPQLYAIDPTLTEPVYI